MDNLTYASILLRIVLAMVFGSTIGIERRQKRRAAGMRTHALVCLGAVIVMLTSHYIVYLYGIGDPSRLGAQVISGIGFLGVGTIIVDRRQQVKGLTTAASLWACACIGLALGVGFYFAAVIGFFCILLINVVLNRVENFIATRSRFIDFYVVLENRQALSAYRKMLDNEELSIIRFTPTAPDDLRGKRDERMAVNIRVKLKQRGTQIAVLDRIRNFEGLISLEEMM